MTHWMDDPSAAAERGANPTVLARMRTGWAVIGITQQLPGYCLLLYAGKAAHLSELPRPERAEFLADMALLGEAVEEVCAQRDPGFRRVNYEILGNSYEQVHAHVHARYHWEPDEFRKGPVWRYGAEREGDEHRLGPRHDALRDDLSRALGRLLDGRGEQGPGERGRG